MIYSDATYEYIGPTTSSSNNEPESNVSDRRDSLEGNSAYNSVFTDSQAENDGQAAKETFRLVRNDSYEQSAQCEGEYLYPTNPMENIYEETAQ